MNIIKVEDLKAGLSCSKPVFVDDDTLFVPAGIPIREKDLTRLKKWGVKELKSEGEFLSSLEEKSSSQLWGIPVDKELFAFYNTSMDQLEGIFDRIHNMEDVSADELDTLSSTLVDMVEKKKDQSIRMILNHNSHHRQMAKSALNSSVLSLAIGFAMNRPKPRLLELANGALLHDIGMIRVPEDIKKKKQGLSTNELNRLRSHTVFSYQIISKELKYSEDIAQIALQHHERWDGEGYPQGKKHEEILLDARIVSIADAFEAMVSERPYRDSMIGYQAMKNIISDNARRFDPEVLRFFIRCMGIYPLSSIVLLNDSSVARVQQINADAPLRPSIVILVDKNGNELPGESGPVINLVEAKDLFIVKAVDINSLLSKDDQSSKR